MSALSKSNEWGSPWRVVRVAAELYGHFELDAAAARWNAKAPRFFTRRDNGLAQLWGALLVWLNPPYSRGWLARWMAKAREEAMLGATVVCLVPHYTSEGWWTQHVVRRAHVRGHAETLETELGLRTRYRDAGDRLWIDVLPIEGRLKFVHSSGATGTARHASALVAFNPVAPRGEPGEQSERNAGTADEAGAAAGAG